MATTTDAAFKASATVALAAMVILVGCGQRPVQHSDTLPEACAQQIYVAGEALIAAADYIAYMHDDQLRLIEALDAATYSDYDEVNRLLTISIDKGDEGDRMFTAFNDLGDEFFDLQDQCQSGTR